MAAEPLKRLKRRGRGRWHASGRRCTQATRPARAPARPGALATPRGAPSGCPWKSARSGPLSRLTVQCQRVRVAATTWSGFPTLSKSAPPSWRSAGWKSSAFTECPATTPRSLTSQTLSTVQTGTRHREIQQNWIFLKFLKRKVQQTGILVLVTNR